MKVIELEGAALDLWVAKAAGYPVDSDGDRLDERESGGAPKPFHPSTDWRDGGPIIERERITIVRFGDSHSKKWEAFEYVDSHYLDIYPGDGICGASPLVAAMRCFVHSKFGDTVEEDAPATA